VKGAENHITKGGAKKVIISAPAEGEDITIVMGVERRQVRSEKSQCRFQRVMYDKLPAPFSKIVNDKWGHRQGPDDHYPRLYQRSARTGYGSFGSSPRPRGRGFDDPDLYRRRQSDIARYSGAQRQAGRVRDPSSHSECVGSRPYGMLSKKATAEEINAALKEASEGKLKGILGYTEDPVVSVDFNHCQLSSIVDGKSTKVIQDDFVKILSWYDNEWGYSNRVVDLALMMIKKGL
jgi:glyceraldehyde 3-phosphate dehydrogenase